MSIETARRVLLEEAEAIRALAGNLTNFDQVLQTILNTKGRVITCGIGKSGHIARKTAGTLSSTGTPALFLHAAEAVHGDLGMITADDIVIMYSHSGETDELVRLFPAIKALGARTVLVTGRSESTASRLADFVLDTRVSKEACSNNLAPTTSTTVMLALSDALAISLMEARRFNSESFARYHPSGALGKRLLLRVSDIMRSAEDCAIVSPDASAMDVVSTMTQHGVGAALVVNNRQELVGIVTEGNLRRFLLSQQGSLEGEVASMMNPDPLTISPDLMAIDAFEIFQNYAVKIGEIPVISEGVVVGLLVLKDLLRSGIF